MKNASTFYLTTKTKEPETIKIMMLANRLCKLRSKRLAGQGMSSTLRAVLTEYLPVALKAEQGRKDE